MSSAVTGGPGPATASRITPGRNRVYLGFVVKGRDPTPLKGLGHEPIITEAMDRDAIIGQRRRHHGGRRPKKYRTYPLVGVLHHECGQRLHAQTRTNRGEQWSYYICRRCGVSVPGIEAEAAVLDAIATMRLPQRAIDRARDALADRLRVPRGNQADAQRSRLLVRLGRLRQQHEWGDITDVEYRAKVRETESLMAELPDGDKLVLFDQHRRVIETMAANIAAASPALGGELVRKVVLTVTARGRTVDSQDIEWSPAVLPFFQMLEVPPDGLEPPTQALGRPRSVH